MLAELLLVLSGHPSSFFIPTPPSPSTPKTLSVSSKLRECLHPGEVASLNTLGELAFNYAKVQSWARDIQRRGREAVLAESLSSSRKGKGKEIAIDQYQPPSIYLSTLAGSVVKELHGYEVLIVATEARILSFDPGLVQDQQGYVPLSSLVATFSIWQAPMASLALLVDTISAGVASSPSDHSPLTPGELLEVLLERSETGNPVIKSIYTSILSALQHLFLTQLVAFLLYGSATPSTSASSISPSFALDIGADPLSPHHRIYALNTDLLPNSVEASTRESILYVGRVAATLIREGRGLPGVMIDELRESVMRVRSLEEGGGLDEAVQRARAEVGEWLWKNVLTGPQITEVIEAFGNFFLTRNADYTLSVIREISKLRLQKLITSNPHSSSSVIREQDLNLALLRASVGTAAESDKAIERLRFKLEKGPLRPLLPSISTKPRATKTSESAYTGETSIRDLFSSSLLGTPLLLSTSISWPLDLFMTPPAISIYSEIHTYLTAIRETHLRVLDCWTSLSASQRQRRKWTGSTEGGTREEATSRRKLARSSWGIIRAMLFFLDQLQSHFKTDIIDVQHRRLLDQMDSATPILGTSISMASASAPSSLRGSIRPPSPGGSKLRSAYAQSTVGDRERTGSPSQSTHPGFDSHTIRSKAPPTPSKATSSFLDFLTLRRMHARHLSFLKEGLLMSDKNCAMIIRDVLDTCKRFTGLVERWGGDVLPELLVEGSSGEKVGEMVKERASAVNEITEELHTHFSDFFRALLDTQNPSAADTSSSNANGISFSRTAKTAQMLQSSRIQRQTSFNAAAKKGRSVAEKEKEERGLEAEALMGRHIEQLLLRLDFNGVLTTWSHAEEGEIGGRYMLAEGGL